MKVLEDFVLALAAAMVLGAVPLRTHADSGMAITFDNHAGRETLTNFPALVKFDTSISGFSYDGFLSNQGHDLRFWNDAERQTALNYEIETWDTNDTSYVWVQVPALAHGHVIYATWGDSDAADQQPYTTNGAVWSEGFAGVYHMAESSGARADSSPEQNHAVDVGTVGQVAGQIGSALNLGADGDYLDTGTTTGVPSGNEPRSILLWYNSSDPANGNVVSLGNRSGNNRWSILVSDGQQMRMIGDNHDDPTWRGGFADNTWGMMGVTWDGTTVRYYLNGAPAGTWNTGVFNTTSGGPIRIGINAYDVSNEYRQGYYDEARVSSVRRSEDWIWACYQNQGTNHAAFLEYELMSNFPAAINTTNSYTGLTTTSVWIQATLTSTGTAATTVTAYWGTNNVGGTTVGWDSNTTYAVHAGGTPAAYSNQLTELLPDTPYYYTFAAANAAGTNWADVVGFVTRGGSEIVVLRDGGEISDGSGPYDFGTVEPGETVAREFVISNAVDALADLVLVNGLPAPVSISGDTNAFSIVLNAATNVVAPGGSTPFSVHFAPTNGGSFNATVSIANNDVTENPYTFSVAGTAVAIPAPGVNLAGIGTGIIGTAAADDGSHGSDHAQSGHPEYVNDGNTATREQTALGVGPLDWVGILFPLSVDRIDRVALHHATFGDGGWFATAEANNDQALIAPKVQITTDGGATWTDVAGVSDDYVSVLTGKVPSGVGVLQPAVTFDFPAQGSIDGIRLFGPGGGTGDGNGFIGVFELEVYQAPEGPQMFVVHGGEGVLDGGTNTIQAVPVHLPVSREYQVLNAASATEPVALTGTPAVVFLESGTTNYGGFTIVGNVEGTATNLAAGESATFTIRFRSTVAVATNATILIPNTTTNRSPYTFMVTAEAVSPLAYYTFDDASNQWADTSGNTNDIVGTAGTDPIWSATVGFGGSGAYDFSSDRLIAPIDVDYDVMPKLTWGAWVRTDSLAGNRHQVLGSDDGALDRTLGIYNGRLYSTFLGNGVLGGVAPSSASDWTFIAATYDCNASAGIGTVKLYVDLNASTATDTLQSWTSTEADFNPTVHTNFSIGSLRPDNGNEPWDGAIDQVFLFDRVLDAAALEAVRDAGTVVPVKPKVIVLLDEPGMTVNATNDLGAMPSRHDVVLEYTVLNSLAATTNLYLTNGSPVVVLSGDSEFTLTSDVPAGETNLAAGARTSFTITFRSDTPGSFTGQVSIASSDTNGSPFTFAITAEAIAPMAYYTFDDANNQWADTSGNGNDITGNAGTDPIWSATSGFDGSGAYDFTDDRLIAPIDVDTDVMPTMTWGAWVRTDALSGFHKLLGSDNGGGDRSVGLDIRGDGWANVGGYRYSAFCGTAGPIDNPAAGYAASNTTDWTFVAVTYDQATTTASIYVDLDASTTCDALSQYSKSTTAFNGTAHTTFSIGSLRPDNGNDPWDGVVDQVFVFDGVLGAAGIQALRDAGGVIATQQPKEGLLILVR